MARTGLRPHPHDQREPLLFLSLHIKLTDQTAIGDPELIERQYPVIIHEFSQRHGSGGEGRYKGGDGCVRDIEFTREVNLQILSQRRAIAPYGMCGGLDGMKGFNFWKRGMPDGSYRLIGLGGNNECVMKKGDHIILRESSSIQYHFPFPLTAILGDGSGVRRKH